MGLFGKSLVIRFIADTARAIRDIERLQQKINGVDKSTARMRGRRGGVGTGAALGFTEAAGGEGWFSSQTMRAFSAFGQAASGVGSSAAAATSSLSRLKNILGGISGKALAAGLALTIMGYAMNRMIHYGKSIEMQMMTWTAITGNIDRSNQIMREALRFSMETPFQPTDVFAAVTAATTYQIDMFKRGLYGMRPDQNVAQILAGLGAFPDMSRGGRGGPIGMERATHAVLRGDIRLLRPYRGMFSGAIDPTTGNRYNAYDAAKAAGPVGSDAFRVKLIEGLSRIPAIMRLAQMQSETVAGLWSTISGFAEEFWIRLSGAAEKSGVLTFWSQLRDILLDIKRVGMSAMEYLYPFFVETGAVIGLVFKAIWDVGKSIFELFGPVLIPIFKILINIIRSIYHTFIFIVNVVVRMFRFTVDALKTVAEWLDKITGFTAWMRDTVSWFENLVLYLQMVFQLGYAYLDAMVNNMGSGFRRLPQIIMGALDEIGASFRNFYNRNERLIRFLMGVSTLGASEVMIRGTQAMTSTDTGRNIVDAGANAYVRGFRTMLNPLSMGVQSLTSGGPENYGVGGGRGAGIGGQTIQNNQTYINNWPNSQQQPQRNFTGNPAAAGGLGTFR